MSEALIPALFLMGPTATGKSHVALRLIEEFPFEIISVDSAQVYRGMDIGTAKVDAKTRARVVHHLIDIRDPNDPYSVAEFRIDAHASAADIVSRGRVPLFVGGTMLYFRALIEGIAELPAADAQVRRQIGELAGREGWEAVHERLRKVDPASAAQIHANDPQRIQRAMEIYQVSGRTMTELKQAQKPAAKFPYPVLQIALLPRDRQALNRRIEERFRRMVERGLVDEVRALAERFPLHSDLPSMKAVGYRQVWKFLAGEIAHGEMIRQGMSASRSLAKRQMTWLRGWNELISVPTDGADPSDEVLKIVGSGDIVEAPRGWQH